MSGEFFLDGNTGAVGRFIGKSKDTTRYGSLKDGCVHVLYRPIGAFSWKPQIFHNVPESAIRRIDSVHPTVPGVQTQGYVILMLGENNKSDFLQALDFQAGSAMRDLITKVKEATMGEQIANANVLLEKDARKVSAQKDSELAQIKEGKVRPRTGFPGRGGEE